MRKVFQVGEIHDGGDPEIFCDLDALVIYEDGKWEFDGIAQAKGDFISKELAVMMIREMAEESEIKNLEEFLVEIEK